VAGGLIAHFLGWRWTYVAAEKDAEKKAGEEGTHHTPARLRRGKLRRERDDELGEAGRDADDETCRGEGRERRRGGHGEQGDDQQRELPEDQAPLVEAVAERHEKNGTGQEAAESQRRDPSGRRRVDIELHGERAEHRRLVVDGARAGEHRHREQDHHASA